MNDIQAVIFDMDGVVFDAESCKVGTAGEADILFAQACGSQWECGHEKAQEAQKIQWLEILPSANTCLVGATPPSL